MRKVVIAFTLVLALLGVSSLFAGGPWRSAKYPSVDVTGVGSIEVDFTVSDGNIYATVGGELLYTIIDVWELKSQVVERVIDAVEEEIIRIGKINLEPPRLLTCRTENGETKQVHSSKLIPFKEVTNGSLVLLVEKHTIFGYTEILVGYNSKEKYYSVGESYKDALALLYPGAFKFFNEY